MHPLPVLLLTLLSPGAAVADDGPQAAMPPVDAIFSGYDHADTPGCALGVIRETPRHPRPFPGFVPDA